MKVLGVVFFAMVRIPAATHQTFCEARMRLVVCSIVAIFSVAGPLLSQTAGARSITAQALDSHIQFLASDLLEGRGTGTRGFDLAAQYVSTELASYGLSPAGTDGGWFQTVSFRKAVLQPATSGLTLTRKGTSQPLKYGDEVLIAADYKRTKTEVSAAVVFVGFGISAPDQNYDDYLTVDVKGKVVAMLGGAPPSFPSTERAYYSSGATKSDNAAAHGALGIINIATPPEMVRSPWERRVRGAKAGGMHWVGADGAPGNGRDEIKVSALITADAAKKLFAGSSHSAESVFDAALHGAPGSFPLQCTAALRQSSVHEDARSENVAGMIRGSDPKLRDQYLVYSAHLDHLGISEPVKGDSINNGAYDNGSGVAVLLELARAFASLTQPPKRSIIFLAVTGEEKGLQGSDYFARFPTVPKSSIVADINMDMFLMLYPFSDAVPFGGEHSTLGEAVQRAASVMGLEVSPDPAPEEVRFVRSDQYSFVKQGIPAVKINPGFKTGNPDIDGEKLTRDWLHNIYHTPQDNPDQKMDLESGVKFAKLNFLIGMDVANTIERPAWKPGSFLGRKFGSSHKTEKTANTAQ
ncbi:MAG: M28 family metallopeptidase [Acidobacteriota bacterium]